MRVPLLIGHRLGRAYGPDSSRRALARSLAGGVRALETDLCLTADGELVVLHDPLLALGTSLSGWAHERSAREILGARLRDRHGELTEESPLGLAELLDLVPVDVLVQLEVKSHADPALAATTAARICESCRAERDRLELISFHSSACIAAASRGFRSRLVVWTDHEPERLAAWARDHRVAGVSIEHFLLSGAMARALRSAGLSVNTGTINEIELAMRAIELAAPDAICSDRPVELRAELDDRVELSADVAAERPVVTGPAHGRF